MTPQERLRKVIEELECEGNMTVMGEIALRRAGRVLRWLSELREVLKSMEEER
jgi:hypothetical protein